MSNNLRKILGNRLKTLRKRKSRDWEIKITQEDVANSICGLGRSQLSLYENGKGPEPSLETLVNLANYYEVNVDYLLGLSDSASKDITIKQLENTTLLNSRAARLVSLPEYKKNEIEAIREGKDALEKKKIINDPSFRNHLEFHLKITNGDRSGGVNFLLGSDVSEKVVIYLSKALDLLQRANSFPVDNELSSEKLLLEAKGFEILDPIENAKHNFSLAIALLENEFEMLLENSLDDERRKMYLLTKRGDVSVFDQLSSIEDNLE